MFPFTYFCSWFTVFFINLCPKKIMYMKRRNKKGSCFWVSQIWDSSLVLTQLSNAYCFILLNYILLNYQNETLVDNWQCPYSRLVYIFDYNNKQFLSKIFNLTTEINAKSLNFWSYPSHVIEAALSTYKLSEKEQTDQSLDIITGCQVTTFGLMFSFLCPSFNCFSLIPWNFTFFF